MRANLMPWLTAAFVVAAFAANPVQSAVLFSDNFDAGASVAWGNQRGNWRAEGGVYDAAAPSHMPETYTDVTTLPSLTDFIIDVDINSFNDGGIWLRSNFNGGSINGVLLVTGGHLGTHNGVYWHTFTNGAFSAPINTQTQAGLQGSNVQLRVVVSGDTYSAYLNGSSSPLTTLTTNLFASGAAGLYDFSPI
jgi:hypothetical protein